MRDGLRRRRVPTIGRGTAGSCPRARPAAIVDSVQDTGHREVHRHAIDVEIYPVPRDDQALHEFGLEGVGKTAAGRQRLRVFAGGRIAV